MAYMIYIRIYAATLLVFALYTKGIESSNETVLIQNLFPESFDKDVSPTARGKVTVDITFSLISIDDLNWVDPSLQWDKDVYGIENIIYPANKIWIPDIIFANSADSIFGDVMEHSTFRLDIFHDGAVSYTMGGQLRTLCDLDTSYFPYDDQICKITLEAWSLKTLSLDIDAGSDVNLEGVNGNGQWELSKVGYAVDNDGAAYSSFKINFYLTRKPLFMILTIVLPGVMLAYLACLTFYMPPEEGKMGYSITVLLSFSVFQLLLADSLPTTSDSTPVLGNFMMFGFCMTALSIIFSLWILSIYHRDPNIDMASWMQTLIFRYLARLVVLRDLYKAYGKKEEAADENEKKETDEEDKEEKKGDDEKKKDPICERLDVLLMKAEEESSDGDRQAKWQGMAKVLDRLFFYIYLIIVTVVVIVEFVIYPSIKNTAECNQDHCLVLNQTSSLYNEV